MMKYNKKNKTLNILKTMIFLAIPTMIEQVLETIVQYVDTAMVGQLGEQATASVSVTTTVNWLLHSILSGFAVGVLALISRSVGEKNQKSIEKIGSLAIWFVVILGLLEGVVALVLSPYIPIWMGAEASVQHNATVYFAILSVPMVFRGASIILGAGIRATGDTKTPMIVMASINILNITLNYVFIYMVGLGVPGAALSSSISYTVGGIWMYVIFHKKILSSNRCCFHRPDLHIISQSLAISIPALLTNMTSCFGYVVFASLVSSMGTTIFAAHSIAVTAETLFYIPGYGMSMAVSTMVGISLGEQDREKFYQICKISIVLIIVMMLINGGFLYAVSDLIMSIFTPSKRVVVIGGQMLRLVAFSEPFFGLMIIMQGILRGLGRTIFSFFIETGSMWLVRILFTFLCVKVWNFSLTAVWFCMIADNVTKAILYLLRYQISKKSLFQIKTN